MLVAYEIQSFKAGTWKIEAIFDDRQLALIDAERLENTGRHAAVRVVEESHDEVTGNTTAKTIFSSGKLDNHNRTASERQSEVRRDLNTSRTQRSQAATRKTQRRAAPTRKRPPSLMWLSVLLVAIVAGGAGVVMILHQV